MALESATHLNDLVATNPVAGDQVSEGDDHIRLIKSVLKTTFPGLTAPVNIGLTDTPQFGGINLGHASDTTLTRSSAGVLAVEGKVVATLSTAQTFTADQTIQSTDTGASAAPTLTLDRNSASPADSDVLGQIAFNGRDDGGGIDGYARILGRISDASAGTEDGVMLFQTLVAGATGNRMQIQHGVILGEVTGGDQGRGTINAEAVFDDGSALCAPMEEAVTGTYDKAAWEALAPHDGLETYEAMKARGYVPTSADSFKAEITARQGVPGYWNKEEWLARAARTKLDDKGNEIPVRVSLAERHERLLLALDLQALAIADLTARDTAKEAVIADLTARIEALEAQP